MKNILIPVDFSVFSETAAKTGVMLAKKTGAELHLMHVANAPSDWNSLSVTAQQDYPEIEGRMVEAEMKLDKFAASSMFKNIKTNTYVYAGVAYDQIVQFIESYKMDLVIVGAHGAGDTNGLFIGSTAQRVIRTANCPVLSVKKDYSPKALKRILFPSDFEENTFSLLQSVQSFAEDVNANIDLLYVNTPVHFTDTETAERKIQKYMPSDNGIRYTSFIYNAMEKERGVLSFSRQQKTDLIAMATHNRRGKPNYWLGVTETILFHSEIPVLSIVLPE